MNYLSRSHFQRMNEWIHTYIFRIADSTLFSSEHGKFLGFYHMLGNKINFREFRQLEITSNIIYYHNEMNLEINNRRNTQILQACKMQSKHQTISRSKKKNEWELESILRQIIMKIQHSSAYYVRRRSSARVAFINRNAHNKEFSHQYLTIYVKNQEKNYK